MTMAWGSIVQKLWNWQKNGLAKNSQKTDM